MKWRVYLFLILFFPVVAMAHSISPFSGLSIPENSLEKFEFSSTASLKNGNFYYEFPRYIGRKHSYPIACEDQTLNLPYQLSYKRICQFFGHQDVVSVHDAPAQDDEEMLWVEENLLTFRVYHLQMSAIVCK